MIKRNSFTKWFAVALSWLPFFLRLTLGLIFIYAGTAKLLDPKAFARIISRYELVPSVFLPATAIGLPALELLAGIGCIFAVRGSLSLTFSLLVFFVAILWYGILNDLNVDCGCFTAEELQNQAGLWQAFYRDLVMMAGVLFLYGYRWIRTNKQISLPLRAKIKRII
jgi:uncharacterized membrane protein YphA (DoxX/SURF4 family)